MLNLKGSEVDCMATKISRQAFILKDQLALRELIWDRIHWVTYRVPNNLTDILKKGVADAPVRVKLTKQFTDVTWQYTSALVMEGKAPPPEIAGAIYNIADDVSCGREINLRAGDYIALQSFIKAKK
jgi:hypothetical protein